VEDAALALSALVVSDRPKITHDEMDLELSLLTDDERAAALMDMFGEYCAIDIHKTKRARRDLDSDSIAFILRQMRMELEKIPDSEKTALIEAQAGAERKSLAMRGW